MVGGGKGAKTTKGRQRSSEVVRGGHRTLSEGVDGVAGRQVGAGDEVLPVGRLHLHPGPALQVAMETAHLTSGQRDVGHPTLAVVPLRTNKRSR